MDALWAFLSDSDNQKTLAWLGGGLVVVAGGVWTVVTFLLGSKKSASAPAPTATTVSATRGGFAAGGDQRIGSVAIDQRRGLSGVQTVLLVLVGLGAGLLAAGLAGDRIAASGGGVAVGTMSGGRIDVGPGATGETKP